VYHNRKFTSEPIQKVSQIFEKIGSRDNRSEKRELSLTVDSTRNNTEIMYYCNVLYSIYVISTLLYSIYIIMYCTVLLT
jgi:hypothetical protein